jgi:uncharacterized membrane protein
MRDRPFDGPWRFPWALFLRKSAMITPLQSTKLLTQDERNELARLIRKTRVTRNVHSELEGSRSFGERLADRVAAFGGSWTFISLFGLVLVTWVVVNSLILGSRSVDPYPYIFLNLLLSMVAAIQAPIIMMSQNRQTAKDRAVQQHDYEVNLKAEIEIMALHDKLDELRFRQFTELLEIQQRQISLLTALQESGKK